MVKAKEDMTGWKMWEHGVPDSRLTVIKQVEDYVRPSGAHESQWLCECSCEENNIITVRASCLKSGNTKSCGCINKELTRSKNLIDMTGWVMAEHGVPDSRWTVIKFAGKNKWGEYSWLCECSCKEKTRSIVTGRNLRSGISKSCGCINKERLYAESKKYNEYDLSGEYGVGYCSNNGMPFYFDLEDYDKIKNHCWYDANVGNRYHSATAWDSETKQYIRMHWLLAGKNYDHANRNSMDNRKENLRPATPLENARNKSKLRRNKSGIIGVSWDKSRNKWVASIFDKGKRIDLGRFEKKDDAIRKRLQAEAEYYKEFAPQQHLFEEYNIKV